MIFRLGNEMTEDRYRGGSGRWGLTRVNQSIMLAGSCVVAR